MGHVDDEERFYLMARGVPPDEAERLIVRGYFADILDRVPEESLRDWLVSLVEAEIAAGTETAGQPAAVAAPPGGRAGPSPVGAGS